MRQPFRIMKRVVATCAAIPDHILADLIEEMGFPSIKLMFESFEGAGAGGPTIEVSTGGMELLTMSVKAKGMHPELYKVMGKLEPWTFKGEVEDELTGNISLHSIKADCKLGSISPDAKSRSGIHGHNLELNSHRTCNIMEGGQELFDWAWGMGSPRFYGQSINPVGDALLGLV